jgi:hypothetical protein
MNPAEKIAILIDGDNAESSLMEQFILEASRFGKVTVKRIYADWTDFRMRKWKEQLNRFAIRPVQKFAYTFSKNTADMALIIDAMDLLHTGHVQGFCIVSSDNDYTGLAHRIREEGLFVMGIGRSNTPEAFQKACETFTFCEILLPHDEKDAEEMPVEEVYFGPKAPHLPGPKIIGKIDLSLIRPLRKSGVKTIDYKRIESAYQMVADINTGLALLSRFSDAIRKVDPAFDHRNFGFDSFRSFCEYLAPNYQVVVPGDGSSLTIKKKGSYHYSAQPRTGII